MSENAPKNPNSSLDQLVGLKISEKISELRLKLPNVRIRHRITEKIQKMEIKNSWRLRKIPGYPEQLPLVKKSQEKIARVGKALRENQYAANLRHCKECRKIL